MKLDVTEILKQVNGDNVIEADEEGKAKPVTVRTVLINALMTPVEKDTGVKKAEKYGLALEIQKNDEVSITPEQATVLKEAVGKPYGPVVVGPIFAILDGAE